jgi:hypothetical protein
MKNRPDNLQPAGSVRIGRWHLSVLIYTNMAGGSAGRTGESQ